MRLPEIQSDYWDVGGLKEARDAGTELVNAFRRAGVDFADTSLKGPCECCKRKGYLISIGGVTPEEALEIAAAVNATLDGLEGENCPLS